MVAHASLADSAEHISDQVQSKSDGRSSVQTNRLRLLDGGLYPWPAVASPGRFTRRAVPGRVGRAVHRGVKRAADVVVSLGLLVALAPLFALLAVLIRVTDGGAVLFWQARVGRDGREF